MTTKQIIFSNKEVKEMTFEEVREQFKPMLIKSMKVTNNKFIYNAVEEDDFMQELEIELWRAFEQYKPETGFCFTTYLYYKIQKGVRNATYYKYAQKNQHNGLISMSAPIGEHDLKLEDMFVSDDTSMSNVEFSELLELIQDNLKEKDVDLFKILIDRSNYTVQDYADEHNITRQAANQRVVKLKKKLQKIVSEQYLSITL